MTGLPSRGSAHVGAIRRLPLHLISLAALTFRLGRPNCKVRVRRPTLLACRELLAGFQGILLSFLLEPTLLVRRDREQPAKRFNWRCEKRSSLSVKHRTRWGNG